MAFPTVPEKLTNVDRNAINSGISWAEQHHAEETGAPRLYVMGWIFYGDEDLSNWRTKGFCYRYSFLTKTFERIQDENYEYDR